MTAKTVEARVEVLENALTAYHTFLDEVSATFGRPQSTERFEPDHALPELDEHLVEFFGTTSLAVAELEPYRGRTLKLLDLMRNPRTRTTKTLASHVIVARAVRHVRESGRGLLILTPTSANKGTALRDAVLRAIEVGLVTADELRVAVVVPRASLPKLWSSKLAEHPALAARNPVLVYTGDDAERVKPIARGVAEDVGAVLGRHGVDVWYTLGLDNYRHGDAVRAAFEADVVPVAAHGIRVHAHAVSSAYGLLGYELGREVLEEMHGAAPVRRRFFIVQHLAAPDMVLSMRHGSFSNENVPAYRLDDPSGLFVQEADPSFPLATFDPGESIDPTFYTRQPPTSALFDALVARHGGSGVVTSLFECLGRYAEIRRRLEPAAIALPADPRTLREWALVMVMTGVLNAIDRDLVPEDVDVLVHASGSYGVDDFTPLDRRHTIEIDAVDDAAEAVLALPR